jgi:hypothetical protein
VHELTLWWRGGRVAEGGGLLNRYRGNTPIVGSNPIPSAKSTLWPAGLSGDMTYSLCRWTKLYQFDLCAMSGGCGQAPVARQ